MTPIIFAIGLGILFFLFDRDRDLFVAAGALTLAALLVWLLFR